MGDVPSVLVMVVTAHLFQTGAMDVATGNTVARFIENRTVSPVPKSMTDALYLLCLSFDVPWRGLIISMVY